MLSISVVVPALNEAATLRSVVRDTLGVLSQLCDDYEVIIVDDGSTDLTPQEADALATEDSHVRVLHNPAPTGYGGALETGFRVATKDVITLITADGEFLPSDLPRFAEKIGGADIVTTVVPNRNYPFYRKVLSWGWRTCMRVLLGICPTLEGTFMIKRALFQEIPLTSRSGMWQMELLIKAIRRDARVVVMDVALKPRADLRESKVANLRTILAVFREILSLRSALKST